jgi:hypothetical protein
MPPEGLLTKVLPTSSRRVSNLILKLDHPNVWPGYDQENEIRAIVHFPIALTNLRKRIWRNPVENCSLSPLVGRHFSCRAIHQVEIPWAIDRDKNQIFFIERGPRLVNHLARHAIVGTRA